MSKSGNIIYERVHSDLRMEESDLIKKIGRYPFFKRILGPSLPITNVDGKQCYNFGSNNYLGLTTNQEVLKASKRAISDWGSGCTGSRLLNGTLAIHEEIENDLATFYGKGAALVFPTGYTANLGILSTILKRNDLVVIDEGIHASLWDGILLANAPYKRFKHNQPKDLERILDRLETPPVLCIIEGVYSMEGDLAKVDEFSNICKQRGIFLLVDEAHALGVIGTKGRGASEHFNVIQEVDAITITFSKSLASCGGAVIGDKRLIEYLRSHARPFWFTASNTPSSVTSAHTALKILLRNPEMVSELEQKKLFFYEELLKNGLPVNKNESAILTIMVGEDFRVLQAWQILWNRGVFCNPVLTPAVKHNHGILRFSIMHSHTHEQLKKAAEICADILPIME